MEAPMRKRFKRAKKQSRAGCPLKLCHSKRATTCVVMPNHIHGIVVRSQYVAHKRANQAAAILRYQYTSFRTTSNRAQTFNEIMRTFKAVTSYYVRRNGNAEFAWQRGYYEHIIRNAKELDFIRSYIISNPAKWQEDKLHPSYPQNTTL